MATVIPLRDFSDNEIVLTAFGEWLNDRAHTKDKTEARTNACVAGVRRFSYFIDPMPLYESTITEVRAAAFSRRWRERGGDRGSRGATASQTIRSDRMGSAAWQQKTSKRLSKSLSADRSETEIKWRLIGL